MQHDVFERLDLAARQAREQNELPDLLAEAILAIAAEPKTYRGCSEQVERLVAMLPEYDTYAQTGYLGMGVNDADIRMQLKAIESARALRERGFGDEHGEQVEDI